MLEELEERLRDARERMTLLEKLRRDLDRVAAQRAAAQARIHRYRSDLAGEEGDEGEAGKEGKKGLGSALADLLRFGKGKPAASEPARRRLHLEAEEAALAALDRDREPRLERLRRLGDPEGDHRAALEEKGRLVAGAGGERAEAILAIAAEEGRVAAVVKEVEEARAAGRIASRELGAVERALGRASERLPLDVIGGGVVSSALRRPALELARKHAGLAEEALRRFHAEVEDLASEGVPSPGGGSGGEFTHRLLDAFAEDVRAGAGFRRSLERVAAAHRAVEGTLSLLEAKAGNLAEIRAGLHRRRGELLG